MSRLIINGTEVAESIKAEVKSGVAAASAAAGRSPVLALVLVGDDAGSRYYVALKSKASLFCGIVPRQVTLPGNSTQDEVVRAVKGLSDDPTVDGVLVQLPLPQGVDQWCVLEAIAPSKDVDGLTATSSGALMCNAEREGYPCCTAAGVVYLLEATLGVKMEGKSAAIVSASHDVSRPLAMMLLNRGASSVDSVNPSTAKDIASHTSHADVVATFVGVPGTITAGMVKEGAIVIDGGYAKVDGKVRGDVDFDAVASKASAITPPTGGVGPMIVAMLMKNTLNAFIRHTKACHQ